MSEWGRLPGASGRSAVADPIADALEAAAIALCWANFHYGEDTPESNWRDNVSEWTKNKFRRQASLANAALLRALHSDGKVMVGIPSNGRCLVANFWVPGDALRALADAVEQAGAQRDG